jgi:hypothetical protein
VYEAWVGALGDAVAASDYEDYSSAERRGFAESLLCTGCEQPAYFIRQARNGRVACFGARPHLEGCEMASTITEDGGTASLPTEEPRVASGDEFVLRSVVSAGATVRHVRHDPRAADGDGQARQYTARGVGGTSTPSMGLGVLLRRLVREPGFRKSRAMLVLPNGSRESITTICVEAFDADLGFRNKWRLYWGTIRYPNVDGEGGAWLNLGRRGSAVLRLEPATVEELLLRHGVDDLEDLQGAAFVVFTPLRSATRTGRLVLFVNDLDWFALRLPDEDPI